MEACLDIYIKLVIAVISFIAPLTVSMLSVFSDGIAMVKGKAEEKKTRLRQLMKAMAEAEDLDVDMLSSNTRDLENDKKRTATVINLLNPQRQIVRIFGTLLLSLGLIMVSMLCKDENLTLYNESLCKYLITGSVATFLAALLVLKQVAWTVIQTKQDIAEQKSPQSVTSS